MGDMIDYFRDIKEVRRQKRAENRESSQALLCKAGVQFTSQNNEAHLIVTTDGGHAIDFWPGTGLWIMRGSTQRHRGVRKLIAFCKPKQEER